MGYGYDEFDFFIDNFEAVSVNENMVLELLYFSFYWEWFRGGGGIIVRVFLVSGRILRRGWYFGFGFFFEIVG